MAVLESSEIESGSPLRVDLKTAQCPICGGPAAFWGTGRDHHYHNSGEWQVFRCTQCSHLFQNPMPCEEDLIKYYPDTYYSHSPPPTILAPSGLRRRRFWLVMHHLKRSMGYRHLNVSGSALLALFGGRLKKKPLSFGMPPFREPGVLLDYGCGSGATVAACRFLGWQAEGVDFDARAAAAGVKAGLNIANGSIELLEQRVSRYDHIMSSHCVEHVPDVQRLFRAFYAALKPGGTLAIDVPNGAAAALEQYAQLFYYLGMPVHVHIFSPESLRHLALETGFGNVEMATYSVWMTQAESALMARSSAKGGGETSAPISFHEHSKGDSRLGSWLSLSTYLRSLGGLRGDCLVMTCTKPGDPS